MKNEENRKKMKRVFVNILILALVMFIGIGCFILACLINRRRTKAQSTKVPGQPKVPLKGILKKPSFEIIAQETTDSKTLCTLSSPNESTSKISSGTLSSGSFSQAARDYNLSVAELYTEAVV